MSIHAAIATLIIALFAGPCAAQTSAQKVADAASYATWGASEVIDTVHSFQAEDRRRAFGLQAARLGITAGGVLLAKYLVHEDRPCAPKCGRDKANTSFLSGHTAFTFSAVGPNKSLQFLLAVPTGSLRYAADKHYLWDIAAGAVLGIATGRLR